MRLISLFLCFVTAGLTHADSKSKATIQEIALYGFRAEAHYAALFPTLGEYLDQLERFNLVSSAEKAQMRKTLAEYKVPLTAKIESPTVSGNTMTWGGLSLEVQKDGAFKTAHGSFLRFTPGLSPDQVLQKTMEAFMPTKKASLFGYLLPEATASSLKDDVLRAIGSGIYGSAMAAYYVSVTLSAGVEIGLTIACGATVMPVHYLKHTAKWITTHGKVACNGTAYQATDLPSFSQLYGRNYESWRRQVGENESVAAHINAASATTCLSSVAGIVRETGRYAKTVGFPPEQIKKYLGKDLPCTPENAKKVQAAWAKDAKAVEKDLEAAYAKKAGARGQAESAPGIAQ